DDALRIDEKKCPVRKHQFLVEDSVAARDLRFGKVAEQRVRQLQRFGERLLRERQVGTDAEVLNPEIYETLEVGLPGRQVRRSRGSEVRPVELEENPLLTPKVIERDIATGGGRQAEGGRWLANLHRRRLPGTEAGQGHSQQSCQDHDPKRSTHEVRHVCVLL